MCVVRELIAATSDPWPGFWLTVLATVIGALIGAGVAWAAGLDLARRASRQREREARESRSREYESALREQWVHLGRVLRDLAAAEDWHAKIYEIRNRPRRRLIGRVKKPHTEDEAHWGESSATRLTDSQNQVSIALANAGSIAAEIDHRIIVTEVTLIVARGQIGSVGRYDRLVLASALLSAAGPGGFSSSALKKALWELATEDETPSVSNVDAVSEFLAQLQSVDDDVTESADESTSGASDEAANGSEPNPT